MLSKSKDEYHSNESIKSCTEKSEATDVKMFDSQEAVKTPKIITEEPDEPYHYRSMNNLMEDKLGIDSIPFR